MTCRPAGTRHNAASGHHRRHSPIIKRAAEAITPLADRSNLRCKLSGLLTECAGAPPEAIHPYVEAMLALFGPERWFHLHIYAQANVDRESFDRLGQGDVLRVGMPTPMAPTCPR